MTSDLFPKTNPDPSRANHPCGYALYLSSAPVLRPILIMEEQTAVEDAKYAGFIEKGRENRVALAARMKRPRLNDKVSQVAEH